MIDILRFGLDTGIEYGHIFTQHLISLILFRGGDTWQIPLVRWLVVSVGITIAVSVYRVYLLSIAHPVVSWWVLSDDVCRVVTNIRRRHFLWAVAVQILVRTVLL